MDAYEFEPEGQPKYRGYGGFISWTKVQQNISKSKAQALKALKDPSLVEALGPTALAIYTHQTNIRELAKP